NWSLGTLKRRLERGRGLLRARLARRGLTLGAPLAATLLAESAASALPAAMLQSAIVTVREATRGGTLDSPVSGLVDHMIRRLAFDKAKGVVAVMVALAIAATGTFAGYRLVARDGGIDNRARTNVEQPRRQRQQPQGQRRRTVPDPTGVPLPAGALLRIRGEP